MQYNNFNLKAVIDSIWNKVGSADQKDGPLGVGALDLYIQVNEPYKKIKTDEKTAKKDVAYLLSHLLRISYELEPLLPNTALKIRSLVKENKMPEIISQALQSATNRAAELSGK